MIFCPYKLKKGALLLQNPIRQQFVVQGVKMQEAVLAETLVVLFQVERPIFEFAVLIAVTVKTRHFIAGRGFRSKD